MDDARLAIAVARDAADHDARIHSYTELIGARPAPDGAFELELRDHIEERGFAARARVIVNATGAWTDAVRTLLFRSLRPGERDPLPMLRPSRGIHLVYPALTRGHGLVLLGPDGRVCFAIPFAGRTLVGTTEIETDSPPAPGDLRPTLEEVRYVRRTLAQALPATRDLPPLAVYAGLRPLLRSDDSVGEASREHAVVVEHGVITIAGGKWTTFRVMARHALAAAAKQLGRTGRKLEDPVEPLPAPLADGIETDPLARFAVAEEMARRVPDVVRRRTTLWLGDDGGRAAAARVATAMAGVLGWSPERAHDEFQRYDAALAEDERLLAAASRE
jgi:glycerol-3-phosphate dehydrogenase